MKKRIIIAVILVIISTTKNRSFAQEASAAQIIKVHLEPTIQISGMSTPNVNIDFNTISNYVYGAESGTQQFKVHSNKDFVVNVRTSAPLFSYSGDAYPTPQMPVNNILFLAISDNNTGGNIAGSFNTFSSLSSIPRDLLLNCSNGGDKSFTINYRANPGTNYPAGDYTVGVIYTATQP